MKSIYQSNYQVTQVNKFNFKYFSRKRILFHAFSTDSKLNGIMLLMKLERACRGNSFSICQTENFEGIEI